jgi:putative hemolysin
VIILDPSDTWQIIFLFLLVIASGFFSASETALMSLNKLRIRHLVDEEIPKATIVQRLIESPSQLLGAILVGNNIVNIAASAIATTIALRFAKQYGIAESVGVAIATGVMTLIILIFGEITPKSLAAQYNEKMSLAISKPIAFLVVLLSPIIKVLVFVTDLIIRLFGGNPNRVTPFMTEEEILTIVNVGHEEGILEGDEREMIHNVFEFGDTPAKDVMTIRADMIAVDIETTYDELMGIYREEQFSRIPVYGEHVDHIDGILYIKDLLFFEGDKSEFSIREFMRPAFYTYEFKKTADLFREMRENRIGMSIVLDEYGGTAGLVTIEDLVEEIVGEIADEYDEEEPEIELVEEDVYIVDGSSRLETVNDMLGTSLFSEDFDSIGGYVIGLIGRLPEIGETVEHESVEFIIEAIDKNRIEKVRIKT